MSDVMSDLTTPRRSPLAHEHAQRGVAWAAVEQMAMPAGPQVSSPLALRDVSQRARIGCKGPQAPAWLAALGAAVPDRFNHWTGHDGLLVARLAATEFLLEADTRAHPLLARIEQALAAGAPGVVPVLRQDCALELAGARVNDLWLQTCNVDFRPLAAACGDAGGPLVMTSMAGVSVLVLPCRRDGEVMWRLWCDPTFGPYLWRTLGGIAEELGGGAVPTVAT